MAPWSNHFLPSWKMIMIHSPLLFKCTDSQRHLLCWLMTFLQPTRWVIVIKHQVAGLCFPDSRSLIPQSLFLDSNSVSHSMVSWFRTLGFYIVFVHFPAQQNDAFQSNKQINVNIRGNPEIFIDLIRFNSTLSISNQWRYWISFIDGGTPPWQSTLLENVRGFFWFLCLKNENIMEGLFSNRKEYTYLYTYIPTYRGRNQECCNNRHYSCTQSKQSMKHLKYL